MAELVAFFLDPVVVAVEEAGFLVVTLMLVVVVVPAGLLLPAVDRGLLVGQEVEVFLVVVEELVVEPILVVDDDAGVVVLSDTPPLVDAEDVPAVGFLVTRVEDGLGLVGLGFFVVVL